MSVEVRYKNRLRTLRRLRGKLQNARGFVESPRLNEEINALGWVIAVLQKHSDIAMQEIQEYAENA